ncbi:MYXO-CTERM domain-containing protein [Asanoa ferruginea]|uniref:MYXO-CTERM domain-containing protein n=1 Tax=Asanoa ferruginea TaxID=53367 RepID=A0A3D9ZU32_9ACTN|nr:hypothetical protein [Asanoa ferruginea]REG00899.1 MYXO-CTERM domain-containing protein [Asanoa ferruginea]GIF47480.1 hypothetical protein Afe04nite_20190 [Asanoa ferruginea]
MSKRFVGKVLACVALGGATLLIAPGIALASDGPGGGEWAGQGDKAYSHCSEWQADEKDGKEHGEKGEAAKGEAPKGEVDKKDWDKKDGDKKECEAPKGWVDGGEAGLSIDSKLATTGGALVGAAALGGLVLVRRRRTDGSVA